jgi:hypothetical protein
VELGRGAILISRVAGSYTGYTLSDGPMLPRRRSDSRLATQDRRLLQRLAMHPDLPACSRNTLSNKLLRGPCVPRWLGWLSRRGRGSVSGLTEVPLNSAAECSFRWSDATAHVSGNSRVYIIGIVIINFLLRLGLCANDHDRQSCTRPTLSSHPLGHDAFSKNSLQFGTSSPPMRRNERTSQLQGDCLQTSSWLRFE